VTVEIRKEAQEVLVVTALFVNGLLFVPSAGDMYDRLFHDTLGRRG
jgi:hypothetical protein